MPQIAGKAAPCPCDRPPSPFFCDARISRRLIANPVMDSDSVRPPIQALGSFENFQGFEMSRSKVALATTVLKCVTRNSASSIALPSQKNPVLLWKNSVAFSDSANSCLRTFASGAAQARASESEVIADAQPKRPPRAARPRKAVMEVTEAAAQRIKELMEQKDPKPHGIRLGVRTRGYVPLMFRM
jgi:hypothetical protein